MNYFLVNKEQLANVLRAIGLLGPDEKLLAVNNLDLLDASQESVGVVLSNAQDRNTLHLSPDNMTEKELKEAFAILSSLRYLLHKEAEIVVKRVKVIERELERREMSADLDEDGIPVNIEDRISDQLRSILYGEK